MYGCLGKPSSIKQSAFLLSFPLVYLLFSVLTLDTALIYPGDHNALRGPGNIAYAISSTFLT
jgi:hypothetical protein